jgi:hypothetical protein
MAIVFAGSDFVNVLYLPRFAPGEQVMQSKKQLPLSAQRILESVKAWKKREHKPQPKKERMIK